MSEESRFRASTTEYRLPFDLDTIQNCPEWLQPYANLSASQFSHSFAQCWAGLAGPAKVFGDWLAGLVSESVVAFGPAYCVALQTPRAQRFLFVQPPAYSRAPPTLQPSIAAFLTPFFGICYGTGYFPYCGFRTADRLQEALKKQTLVLDRLKGTCSRQICEARREEYRSIVGDYSQALSEVDAQNERRKQFRQSVSDRGVSWLLPEGLGHDLSFTIETMLKNCDETLKRIDKGEIN
ncbi:MAG: hypothetical protein GY878_01345 [Fuerstiella sp.]|nr:hypothetical protein [Fuerstiella sp.]